jgi:hypothetical protein
MIGTHPRSRPGKSRPPRRQRVPARPPPPLDRPYTSKARAGREPRTRGPAVTVLARTCERPYAGVRGGSAVHSSPGIFWLRWPPSPWRSGSALRSGGRKTRQGRPSESASPSRREQRRRARKGNGDRWSPQGNDDRVPQEEPLASWFRRRTTSARHGSRCSTSVPQGPLLAAGNRLLGAPGRPAGNRLNVVSF